MRQSIALRHALPKAGTYITATVLLQQIIRQLRKNWSSSTSYGNGFNNNGFSGNTNNANTNGDSSNRYLAHPILTTAIRAITARRLSEMTHSADLAQVAAQKAGSYAS
ncbi:hypothetical protein BDN72DRAFT_146662 [Pluteus cervinus]|uniref:Uncharacterized protein n=1 Tax=Pluteus cervinus TaxID=181527 RepID=A0ACD3ALB7_9AGAR|nr:hypothetical protein BDN72DRAFT_146662 [Pluteus cervinus]